MRCTFLNQQFGIVKVRRSHCNSYRHQTLVRIFRSDLSSRLGSTHEIEARERYVDVKVMVEGHQVLHCLLIITSLKKTVPPD